MKLYQKPGTQKSIKSIHPFTLITPNRKFQNDVDKLSYRQLIRISTVVDATNEAERKEASRLVHSLTPVERKIVSSIKSGECDNVCRKKRQYIQTRLKNKNAIETQALDTDTILASLRKGE